MKLSNLIKEYQASAVIFTDSGNGSGYGADGIYVDIDDLTDSQLNLVMLPNTNDTLEAEYMSEAQTESADPSGYTYQIFF